MDTAARDYYPSGDVRVSDAERDLALSELGEALRAGRITADEFDQRSGQVLAARTGKDLTAPLADLPVDRAAASGAALERPRRATVSRFTIGASVAAACFTVIAVVNALNTGPTLQQRESMQEIAARLGISMPVPPASGFNWAGTITPAVVAVLIVVMIIVVRCTRPDAEIPGEAPRTL
jgi:Domain of unknown function (DUF1707)